MAKSLSKPVVTNGFSWVDVWFGSHVNGWWLWYGMFCGMSMILQQDIEKSGTHLMLKNRRAEGITQIKKNKKSWYIQHLFKCIIPKVLSWSKRQQ